MRTDESRNTPRPSVGSTSPGTGDSPAAISLGAARGEIIHELERDVEHILDDCFFTVGQVVGMRMTADYDAIVWWRDHFRPRFLAAMNAFGNRWLQDRANVTGVGLMLGERAVRYASGRESIDVDSARKAAADVERYCGIHARRRSRDTDSDGAATRIAGYWCYGEPIPPG